MKYIYVVASKQSHAIQWIQQYLTPLLGAGPEKIEIRVLYDIEELRSIGGGDAIVFLARGWQHSGVFRGADDRIISEIRMRCRARDILLLEEI